MLLLILVNNKKKLILTVNWQRYICCRYIHICMYIYMHACMCVCMHVCMYICRYFIFIILIYCNYIISTSTGEIYWVKNVKLYRNVLYIYIYGLCIYVCKHVHTFIIVILRFVKISRLENLRK